MNKLLILGCLLVAVLRGAAQPTIPHLQRTGTGTQLVVNGKPMLMLGGELHNSNASGAAHMRPIWKQMAQKNLNTVLAPVYWELLEPVEGRFDFSLVDSMLLGARRQRLHLVILWFGTWKNGYSMYTPGWIKNNPAKYPHAKGLEGKTVEQMSTFGQATAQADARAFGALMQHIRKVDAKQQTVIMAQIENEVGLFYTPRDYSEAATQAYTSNVPPDLMDYLAKHKGQLQPELDSAWHANGAKATGSWETVFGKSTLDKSNWKALSYLPEELFTVYHYAHYLETVAAAGKAAYPIPMYANAWLKQPHGPVPGRYPSGGPTPHTFDIWHAAAPSIDMLVPDIYLPDARPAIAAYDRPGNPYFIPEIRPTLRNANLAFWAFGQHPILGYSPFGIEDVAPEADPITKTYAVLAQVQDLIIAHQVKGTMLGILLDTTQRSQNFTLGGYKIKASMGASANFTNVEGGMTPPPPPKVAGGLLFAIGPDEFIVVGKNFSLLFQPEGTPEPGLQLNVEMMEEGTFRNGQWVRLRRLNGDEGTGGGDYGFGFGPPQPAAVMKFQGSSTGDYSIVRYKLYRYK